MTARLLALFALALVVAALRQQAPAVRAAGTIYVNAAATGANNGSSWADAYTDLQAALGVANSGDQVWVAAGTYKPTSGTDRAVSFQMETGVAVYGGFAGTETALTQRNPATYQTVLNGNLGDPASNIDNSNHVVIANGVAATAVLDGVTISEGKADDTDTGGGLQVVTSGGPSLANVLFDANEAPFGGAVAVAAGTTLTITNTTFSANGASGFGGALQNLGTVIATNVTFSANGAGGRGGAIFSSGKLTVTNGTFAGNDDGIGSALSLQEGSTTELDGSLLWGNPGEQINRIGGALTFAGKNLVQGGCPAGDGITCNPANVIDADPKLGPLIANGGPTWTMALAADSPAIDAGTNAGCPTTDQRGLARPKDGPDADTTATCDLGAYEYFVPKIQFKQAASSGLESVARPTFEVTLDAPTVQPVPVDLSLAPGTATRGVDYDVQRRRRRKLVIPAGATTLVFPDPVIANDQLDENHETLFLTVASKYASPGEVTRHTYTILDDDPRPFISFTTAESQDEESVTNPATAVVQLSKAVGRVVTIDYRVTGGSATPGDDFDLADGTLTFNPGETQKTIPLQIVSDNLDENHETVEITIENPFKANFAGDAIKTHTYTIHDDDPRPLIGFATAESEAPESELTPVIEVKLSKAVGRVVTVAYAVTGGTATPGQDFFLPAGVLTFAPGETVKTLPFKGHSGFGVEPDETVEITLSDPFKANFAPDSIITHTYTILNDDEGSCDGVKATRAGTEGDDVIVGTSGDDVIDAKGGNDRVFGRGGNDLICGEDGNDVLFGGDDSDRILGGNGNDIAHGGAGNDGIRGMDGDDRLQGGADNDRVVGEAGADRILGGGGEDVLDGGTGNDIVRGLEGNDTVLGGGDTDRVAGDQGDDRLSGGGGTGDACDGGAGTDALLAGHGCETMVGVP